MSNHSFAHAPSYTKCSHCGLMKFCLPSGLDLQDMIQLENIIELSAPYSDHQAIFHANQNFESVYAVKSGMFKTVVVDANGSEHIIGFHLPGELFGLDAIYPKKYISTAISLGTSTVCEIHYTELETLAGKLPSLQRQLFCLMSKEVHTLQSQAVEHPADQKLAGFILGLSVRYKLRGYSPSRINLMMPRRDIASHLNMAAETVSRLFKRFQKEGLIQIKRSDLEIIDMDGLKQKAGCASYY